MAELKSGDKVICLSDRDSFGSKYGAIHRGHSYTVLVGGESHIKLKETDNDFWYLASNFKKVEDKYFDMVNNFWFIKFDNTNHDVVVDFIKSNNIDALYGFDYNKNFKAYCNFWYDGPKLGDKVSKLTQEEIDRIKKDRELGLICVQEIKLTYTYKKVIDKVDYPEVKSLQELEIEKIEKEMRNLADRLNKLKGNNYA